MYNSQQVLSCMSLLIMSMPVLLSISLLIKADSLQQTHLLFLARLRLQLHVVESHVVSPLHNEIKQLGMCCCNSAAEADTEPNYVLSRWKGRLIKQKCVQFQENTF